jgi:hypothetical protein
MLTIEKDTYWIKRFYKQILSLNDQRLTEHDLISNHESLWHRQDEHLELFYKIFIAEIDTFEINMNFMIASIKAEMVATYGDEIEVKNFLEKFESVDQSNKICRQNLSYGHPYSEKTLKESCRFYLLRFLVKRCKLYNRLGLNKEAFNCYGSIQTSGHEGIIFKVDDILNRLSMKNIWSGEGTTLNCNGCVKEPNSYLIML